MSSVWNRSLNGFSSTGFVDLQTEKADLMESVGAIPFLNYKHFAARIFFPEVREELEQQLVCVMKHEKTNIAAHLVSE